MRQSRHSHATPYFKVQLRDPFSFAWRDYRGLTFETEERARAFRATLQGPVETRIMRCDEHGAAPVPDAE